MAESQDQTSSVGPRSSVLSRIFGKDKTNPREAVNTGPWKLAPQIGERTKKAREYKSLKRSKEGEFWKVGFGKYGWPLTGWAYKQRESQEELVGAEVVLKKTIEEILEAKRNNDDSTPVIAVDFGGMYSLSFLRIAAELEKKDNLISSGNVVLIVTNLEFTVDYGIQTAGQGYNDIGSDELALVQKYKHLVHYIKSDAAELRNQEITLPSGQTLKIKESIDLIHEMDALMHGAKNDTDLPLLARNLSTYGILFLGSKYLHPALETPEEKELRERAHQYGKENLVKEGLSKVDIGPEGHYEIYSKKSSPRIPLI